MEKTRTLPIDYGIESGRQLYNTITKGVKTSSEPLVFTERYAKTQFAIAQAAAAQPMSLYAPGFEGYQRFESSEMERPVYNSCLNEKLTGIMYPYCMTYKNIRYNDRHFVDPYRIMPAPSTTYRNFVLAGKDVGASLWNACEGARRRAWWNMQPRFEGRISMLNFIFELKDFRDIMKHALRVNYRDLGESMKNLKKLLKSTERKVGFADLTVGTLPKVIRSLDASTRGLAALYLTNEFAIKPTVRDVLTIHSQAAAVVAQAQEDFFDKGQQQQRAHYSEVLFNDAIVEELNPAYFYMAKKQVQKARFTASMEYYYTYRKRPALAAFRKYWGLDFTAEVVWNALPLSFVLDYFIGVADSLHAMGSDPNVNLQTTQYCESLLYEREAGTFTTQDPRIYWLCLNGQWSAHGVADKLFTGFRFSRYERRVGEPDRGPALPRLSLPSVGQATSLVALLRCWI
jgi:hypothetical protein